MSQESRSKGYGDAVFEDDSISLGEIFRILARNYRLIVVIWLMVTTATVLWVVTQTPKYRAQATLLLEEDEATGGVLSELASLTSDPAAEAEIALIGSRSLAEVTAARPREFVIKEEVFSVTEPDFDPVDAVQGEGLNLADGMDQLGLSTVVERFDLTPSFGLRRRFLGGEALVHRLYAWFDSPESADAEDLLETGLDIYFSEEDTVLVAPHKRFLAPAKLSVEEGALELRYQPGVEATVFGCRLKLAATGDYVGQRYRVRSVSEEAAIRNLQENTSAKESGRKTNVVHVSVEHLSPFVAAETANALAKNYIRRSILIGRKKAVRTSGFIEFQLKEQSGLLEVAEQLLAKLQSENPETISLEGSTQAVIDQLTTLELSRTQAELAQDALSKALVKVKAGEFEALSRFSREVPSLVTLTYLQSLAELDSEIARLRGELNEDAPTLQALVEARGAMREQVQVGLTEQIQGFEEEKRSVASKIEELELKLGSLPRGQADLAAVVRDVQTRSEIVGFLLRSKQEAEIAAAATSATAVLIDPAVPPSIRAFPRATLFTLIGSLLGVIIGCAGALGRNSMQAALHTEAEVERASGLSVLGAIPDFERGRTRIKGAKRGERVLPMRDDPEGAQAEAYRSVRAALRRVMRGEDALKTLACTSCVMGEGKTVTNADLAIVFAKAGRKVLLVDCDLRKPQVHNLFKIDRGPGFSEVLEGSVDWEKCVVSVGIDNLKVLPAGERMASPGELLASDRALEVVEVLKSEFDLVVFDLPPAVVVADVANFASNLDALLLVYRSGVVPGRVLTGAAMKMRRADVNLVGVIVNAVYISRGVGGYGYGYGYGTTYGKERDS